jgi:hypothetical protein
MAVRSRLAVIVVTLASAVASVRAAAQDSTARAARAVADAFFRAARERQWVVAAGYLDMAQFERFFRNRVNDARAAVPPPEPTVEEILAREPDMPRAVAEWQAAQSRKAQAQYRFGDYSFEFARVTSFRDLAALTPLEAAGRWIEAQDPREAFQRMLALSNCDSVLTAEEKEQVSPFHPNTIGALVVGDSIAYVLHTESTRLEVEPADAAATLYHRSPSVMALRRTTAGWRIVPQHDLLRPDGMAYGMSCEPRRKR